MENFKETGTTVTLSGIYKDIDIYELSEYIKKEFACLLELNKQYDFSIYINGEKIIYEELITERENFELNYKYGELNINAKIRYVQWKNNLSNEYSRYYFADQNEKFKLSMAMQKWIDITDKLISFRDKKVLKDSGKVFHKQAIEKAENEYEKFRIKQDREYISSMDEMYKKYLEENKK